MLDTGIKFLIAFIIVVNCCNNFHTFILFHFISFIPQCVDNNKTVKKKISFRKKLKDDDILVLGKGRERFVFFLR